MSCCQIGPGVPDGLGFDCIGRLRARVRPALFGHTHERLHRHVVLGQNLAGKADLSEELALRELVILRLRHPIRLTRTEPYAARRATRLTAAAVTDINATGLDNFNEAPSCGNLKGSDTLNRKIGHKLYTRLSRGELHRNQRNEYTRIEHCGRVGK